MLRAPGPGSPARPGPRRQPALRAPAGAGLRRLGPGHLVGGDVPARSGSCHFSCPCSQRRSSCRTALRPRSTSSSSSSMSIGRYTPSTRRSPARRAPWLRPVSEAPVLGDAQGRIAAAWVVHTPGGGGTNLQHEVGRLALLRCSRCSGGRPPDPRRRRSGDARHVVGREQDQVAVAPDHGGGPAEVVEGAPGDGQVASKLAAISSGSWGGSGSGHRTGGWTAGGERVMAHLLGSACAQGSDGTGPAKVASCTGPAIDDPAGGDKRIHPRARFQSRGPRPSSVGSLRGRFADLGPCPEPSDARSRDSRFRWLGRSRAGPSPCGLLEDGGRWRRDRWAGPAVRREVRRTCRRRRWPCRCQGRPSPWPGGGCRAPGVPSRWSASRRVSWWMLAWSQWMKRFFTEWLFPPRGSQGADPAPGVARRWFAAGTARACGRRSPDGTPSTVTSRVAGSVDHPWGGCAVSGCRIGSMDAVGRPVIQAPACGHAQPSASMEPEGDFRIPGRCVGSRRVGPFRAPSPPGEGRGFRAGSPSPKAGQPPAAGWLSSHVRALGTRDGFGAVRHPSRGGAGESRPTLYLSTVNSTTQASVSPVPLSSMSVMALSPSRGRTMGEATGLMTSSRSGSGAPSRLATAAPGAWAR